MKIHDSKMSNNTYLKTDGLGSSPISSVEQFLNRQPNVYYKNLSPGVVKVK